MAISRRTLLGGVAAGGLATRAAGAQPLVQGAVPLDTLVLNPKLSLPRLALVRPRLNVASLSAGSKTLTSFRAAIAAMQALPASDPRSWEAQAQRHNDSCAHRNWYTWPWHRAFLLQFERICRNLSGDNDFRVPYWNWTVHRQIPATFSQPMFNGATNPLFHPRTQSATASLGDAVVGTAVIDAILAEPNFEAFMSRRPTGQNNTDASWQRTGSLQGPLEFNPHNTIHGWIGGDMGTFVSPRDPIFWLHHANLDRLWERWNKLGHANTTDPLWLEFQFANQFVTGSGAPYAPRVKNLQKIQSLGYTYDQPLVVGLPPLVQILPTFDWSRLRRAETTVAGGAAATLQAPADVALRTSMPVAEITARSLAAVLPANRQGGAPEPRTAGRVLALVDAAIPENAPAPQVRVFLNCDYLAPDTPSIDPHYVGSFSFFGMAMPMAGDAGATRFVLDLTRTLVALGAAGTPTDQLRLQFQPIGNGANSAATVVSIARVEIAVS